MRSITTLVILAIALLCTACNRQETSIEVKPDIDWIYHVDSLLMPYWMMEEALGDPVGNFPTYRDKIGSVMTMDNVISENLNAIDSILFFSGTDNLRREFLRMKSRQTFGYGVAYHLTGNEAYLTLAKKGTEYLLENGEYDTGLPVNYWVDGKGYPEREQRNSQDLAYSLTGPTFYYFLTRDPAVLEKILKVKASIFEEYYRPFSETTDSKYFAWVNRDFENETTSKIELVGQLDQLNAYMLLLTSLVPENLQVQFSQELLDICYLMKDHFYNEEFNLFRGALNVDMFQSSHTDFGHSIKTFWMMYQVSKLVDDQDLMAFSESNARKLLQTAFVKSRGSWAWKFIDASKKREESNLWWIFAELDQMTASLSLKDTTLYTTYLKKTYPYWETYYIDKDQKETWIALDDKNNVIHDISKAGVFKNAYHSLEHAMIGYLSTNNYYGKASRLYFAVDKKNEEKVHFQPYYYKAKIVKTNRSEFNNSKLSNFEKIEILFDDIQ